MFTTGKAPKAVNSL